MRELGVKPRSVTLQATIPLLITTWWNFIYICNTCYYLLQWSTHSSCIKNMCWGNTLVIQWLGLCAFTAEGPDSVPGLGTKISQDAKQKKKKKICWIMEWINSTLCRIYLYSFFLSCVLQNLSSRTMDWTLAISNENTESWGFPVGSDSKESACNAGDLGSVPGLGRSPGEGNGNPLQFLAWRCPWTKEPGGLQSMGSQRVRQDWVINIKMIHLFSCHRSCRKKINSMITNFEPHYSIKSDFWCWKILPFTLILLYFAEVQSFMWIVYFCFTSSNFQKQIIKNTKTGRMALKHV